MIPGYACPRWSLALPTIWGRGGSSASAEQYAAGGRPDNGAMRGEVGVALAITLAAHDDVCLRMLALT